MKLIFLAVVALAVALIVQATISPVAGGVAVLLMLIAYGVAYVRFYS